MSRYIGLVLALAVAAAIPHEAVAFGALGSSPHRLADTSQGLVQKVHGCHKFCAWGYVFAWDTAARHRHKGPFCEPRPCGRRFHHHPGIHGCFKIGPVWYCP